MILPLGFRRFASARPSPRRCIWGDATFGCSPMVYLSRIYTKSGDQGETGLGDGTRVPKDHPRVAAYGTVDELNSVLGVLLTLPLDAELRSLLQSVQNDLFDVGADLCVPQT